jgi:peptidoglycan hydrolase CwlO-like protein
VKLIGAEGISSDRVSSPVRANISPSTQGRVLGQIQSEVRDLENKMGALDKKWNSKFDKCISQIEQITSQMSRLMVIMSKLSAGKEDIRNRSPSPILKKDNSQCFLCGDTGHF